MFWEQNQIELYVSLFMRKIEKKTLSKTSKNEVYLEECFDCLIRKWEYTLLFWIVCDAYDK